MRWIIFLTLPMFFITGTCTAQKENQKAVPEFFEKDYLFDVIRHLYRWYLDERDVEKVVGNQDIAFRVRELKPKLDEGDKSQFGEIVIADLNVKVSVKKADYTIDELGLSVRCDTFKIINVNRGNFPVKASGYTIVKTSYEAMRDYAHRTRMQTRFPDDELLMRMRLTARKRILQYFENRQKDNFADETTKLEELKKQDPVIHLSPLSNVANEAWIFWENGRMLIRFSSDIDLENPALWDHDEMAVELFNIDEQTVVSLDEVAGSNAYMTRDQVGRALYNCIILGKRLILKSLDD
jgi:hypothetical protein